MYDKFKFAIQSFILRVAISQAVWYYDLETEFNVGRCFLYLLLIILGCITSCLSSKSILRMTVFLIIGEVLITIIIVFSNELINDYISYHLCCLIYRYVIFLRYFLSKMGESLKGDLKNHFYGISTSKKKTIDNLDVNLILPSPSKPTGGPRRSKRLSNT